MYHDRDYHTSTVDGAAAFEAGRARYAYYDDEVTMADVYEPPDICREESKRIRQTVHRARKDHFNRFGKLVVHKGRLYRLTVRRCRRMERDNEEEDWEYTRWLEITKTELKEDKQ